MNTAIDMAVFTQHAPHRVRLNMSSFQHAVYCTCTVVAVTQLVTACDLWSVAVCVEDNLNAECNISHSSQTNYLYLFCSPALARSIWHPQGRGTTKVMVLPTYKSVLPISNGDPDSCLSLISYSKIFVVREGGNIHGTQSIRDEEHPSDFVVIYQQITFSFVITLSSQYFPFLHVVCATWYVEHTSNLACRMANLCKLKSAAVWKLQPRLRVEFENNVHKTVRGNALLCRQSSKVSASTHNTQHQWLGKILCLILRAPTQPR